MTLASETLSTDFRRDGSFIDEALEADFRARVWKRDCGQLHAITIPAAFALLTPVVLDGSTVGWNSTLFHIDLSVRLVAALLCLITFLVYRSPPQKAPAFNFPFATTLAANSVILYAVASGANGVVVATPCAIAATLAYWAFVPLKTRYLLIAGGSLCLGYLTVLLIWVPIDYQTLVIAPILLIMINAMGFFHIRNRNMSERQQNLVGQELLIASENLQKEMETRVAAEKSAGANEEIFQGLFVSSPVPLCMIDTGSGDILQANKLMSALLGFDGEGLPDRPIRHFFLDDSVFEELTRVLLKEHAVLHNEVRLRSMDGSLKWVLLSARQFSMPDRQTVLASFVDITDQKEKENDLALAKSEAQKANFAKSQFLANMSHELRTPLNAIIGFSDIMESEVFGSLNNQRYTGYISDIKTSGIHLLSIINEILDLSKIESGKEDLYQEEVDLSDIVEIAMRLVRHHAEEKQIGLRVDFSNDELVLMADERAIKQIILNLLSNAIKFTPEGGSIVVMTAQITDHIVVQVCDTGIGIAADELGTIAEPFVQLESSLTNANAGTGLGLSIATRLAELHGGRIEFESVLGEGTTASLILPHLKDENLEIG